jgi:branched-chain amino acid aminotransferase
MVDGNLVGPSDPVVVIDDGLVRGDGVFEGLRQYGRRLRTLDAHLDRLMRSGAQIRLDIDRGLVERELREFCALTTDGDSAVRVIVTRSGQRIIREEPLPDTSTPWRLAPVEHRVTPLLDEAKTLSYAPNMQAERLAEEAGADHAMLIRADDHVVLEGPTFSIGWIEGDSIVFPPISSGVLDSITRRLVCEVAEGVLERETTPEALAAAEAVACFSTVAESVAVSELVGVSKFDPDNHRLRVLRTALAERCRAGAAEPSIPGG